MNTTIERPDWLRSDTYPFTQRAIELGPDTVTYIDEGEGPTLLFVHIGMWSFVFRDAIERLHPDFRCITLDPPGYGPTPEAPNGRSLGYGQLSDLVGRFIDALDLTSTTLVAHDLGGPASVAAAGSRPERFAGLVLVNTFLWEPDTRALRTMLRIVGGPTMTAVGTATNLVPRLTAGSGGVGRHLDDRSKATFLGPYRDRSRRRRFHTTMRSVLAEPVVTRAAEQAAHRFQDLPVLTIFGEKNDPFGFQDRHAATFNDHEGLIVEDGNHFPMMDDVDLFADTVRNWHRRKIGDPAVGRHQTGPDPATARN